MSNSHVPTWHTIELCQDCGGRGTTWEYGYANSTHEQICLRCNGHGRIKVTTTRLEKPFADLVPEKPKDDAQDG